MKDLTGQRFGKLIVLSLDHKEQAYLSNGKKNGFRAYYLCKCDCGNETIVQSCSLISGKTKSCGCLLGYGSKIGELTRTHGKTKTRLYKIWAKIKERCYNPKAIRYKNYGGRGIKVCSQWLNFEPFYEWSITNGYNDTLTIDRINNNGNYEPSNCRWVTDKVQARNKTTNKLYTYNNETHCLPEWAEIINISESKLRQRLCKLKWSVERAFNTP